MRHNLVDGICAGCNRSEELIKAQNIAEVCDGWGGPLQQELEAVIDAEYAEVAEDEEITTSEEAPERRSLAVCPSCGAELEISIHQPE